ncbi:MAG: hypothetical protein NC307_14380 [Roseburia sp.]|nr:hypothetical protein [Roseburia sp.]
MILAEDKSICKKRQKIIVSKENGREHRANNKGEDDVRKYKLDGDLVKNEKCCDYLVLNDTKKNAYFIELKGRNVSDAVEQLEAGKKKVELELEGYKMFFRIVGSKMRTHEIENTQFRKMKVKYEGRLGYKSVVYEKDI